MRISILACTLIFISACRNQEESNEIVIQGNVKGIPDGKVYLTEAHFWNVDLDSTMVKDGKFEFRIKPDSGFYPYLAGIYYPDSNNTFSGRTGLMFTDSKSNGFYLEEGITRITSDTAKPLKTRGVTLYFANVNAGKQNEVYVKNMMSDFGWIRGLDSVKRKTRIEYFKNEIRKYPYSYFLLESIFNAKNQYSIQESNELLHLFELGVQTSALADKFRKYLATKRSSDQPYPNLSLFTAENKRQLIIDSTSKINMIVFWASWCNPCRGEIPALKKIYQEFGNQKLNMSSISVDKDESDWRKALQQEHMNWTQFIVRKEEKELVNGQFDASFIPVVIFTDRRGLQLARFVGFEKGQEMKYDSIITSHLKEN